MTYNRTLDGLRGVAILLVLLFHYKFLLGFGWLGVQLFFVLSGYLITSILLEEKNNPVDLYLKRFYWRRTLRIFPLYYSYVLFAAVTYFVMGIPEDFFTMFPYLVTYTFNFYPLFENYTFQDFFFTHFWSLSVEEQFYLAWPIIIYTLNGRYLKVVLIGIIAFSPLIRYILAEVLLSRGLEEHYVGEIVYRFTLSQLDGFAFGALIPVFSLNKRNIPIGKLLLLLTGILILLGAFNAYQIISSQRNFLISSLGFQIGSLVNFQHVWSYTLFDLLFSLIILLTLNPVYTKNRTFDLILGNRVLVYFGKISYGLYVYHWVIWMVMGKYLSNYLHIEPLAFLLYLVICLSVASISYFVFERPLLSLKDKFFVRNKIVTA